MLYLKGSRSVILYIWTQLSRLNPDLCTLIISTQSHTNYTLDSTQSHTIRCHHHCITLPVKKHISMQTRVHGKEVAANSFQLISWIIAKINLSTKPRLLNDILPHTLYNLHHSRNSLFIVALQGFVNSCCTLSPPPHHHCHLDHHHHRNHLDRLIFSVIFHCR